MTGYLDRDPRPDDPLRLFCFHHAGAGASAFGSWRTALAPDIAVYPVQLPGRETRIGEPRITDFAALVDDLDRELDRHLTGDYALYGHSMGAAVSAALAARRVSRGRPLPAALLVGAYPGPHLGPPLSVTGVSDADLVDLLVEIGGMSELVRRYPEWSTAAVGLLRADLDLLHSYRPGLPVPLPIPITAYTGTDDPLVARTGVEQWAHHTTAGFGLRALPGGHFFLRDSAPALLGDIARSLTTRVRRRAAS